MKKYLISTLGLLVATFMFVSQGFSATSITVQFELNLPFNNVTNGEIPTGSCIMLILASSQTALDGVPSAPDFNNPYFLSNGDILLPTIDTSLYPAINPYFSFEDFGTSPFPYETFVETSSMVKGSKFYVYARLFDNLSGVPGDPNSVWSVANGYDFLPSSSFDASGNYNGNNINGSNKKIYYMDSQLFELTVPDPLAVADPTPIVFTVNPDQFQLLNVPPTTVPEPSVMFLMAGGLCWMFSRLRRK